MLEEHCVEVDARIREIVEDNDHDKLDEDNVIHYYGEIHEIFTRFVLLHHGSTCKQHL
jgi:mannitol-specific phosphotransferase system IIBC component